MTVCSGGELQKADAATRLNRQGIKRRKGNKGKGVNFGDGWENDIRETKKTGKKDWISMSRQER